MTKTTISCIEVNDLNALGDHGLRRVAAAIGVFDGVHRGHRHLLAELMAMAGEVKAEPVVLTFHPHPREILHPHEPILMLVSREKKLELLHAAGIRAVVTLPFTRAFAALAPEDFLRSCLAAPRVTLVGLCVGSRWRFGADGAGDAATVDAYARHGHFAFRAVPEQMLNGQVVSSTAIRRAVTGGLLDDAATMLGRPYGIEGMVESGQQIAGPVLDCPTANLDVHHGIVPPAGVYAGYAVVAGQRQPAAIAIGAAPTFRHHRPDRPIIEVHILDFTGNLYGRRLEVEFVRHLREERCFSSPEMLRAQIIRDLAAIRRILADANGATLSGGARP
jgi:riboflavin kinase/FMN adenylyltransferase